MRAFFKSLHQTDSKPGLSAANIPCQPPYLDCTTLAQSSPLFCIRPHLHLPSNAMLKLVISLMSRPPFSLDEVTVSHLIHAILFWSSPPPQRNLRCSLTNLSTTNLSALKKEKKYRGMDVSTDLINVTLPPMEMCFCCHFASFLSHLWMMGSHIRPLLGFAPNGIPR
ncbi:hypothetical protein GLYMA_20G104800v4 [Glycine max]|uniref:Uncharacterized protein n=1 Tax=Glycine max TaxID=3847 RepID=K7N2R4_SOYBN|nr:hypothetical protein JHK85_056895 [Glycine max]KAG5074684.1 hypothetical protein JHK84_055915 [Glycine max]KAH1035485.1 hypothetical protein GYH30_055456 [Glycine max]KRG90633.1 hypothetical protein GLYMA_20G104800v4 [Glycine max]